VHLADMNLQRANQFELFSTLSTGKWPVISMFQYYVSPKQVGPLETSPTLTAYVWCEIEVNFLVRIPRACLSKCFATDTTRKWPLSCMGPHMVCQTNSTCTSTSTFAADEWLIFTALMLTHVLVEVLNLPILPAAFGA